MFVDAKRSRSDATLLIRDGPSDRLSGLSTVSADTDWDCSDFVCRVGTTSSCMLGSLWDVNPPSRAKGLGVVGREGDAVGTAAADESRLRSEATFPRTSTSSLLLSPSCSLDLGLCSGLARGERGLPGTGTGRRSGDTAGEDIDFLPREGGGGGGARFAVTLMSDEDVDWRSDRADKLAGRSPPPTDARERCAGRSGVKNVGLHGAADDFTGCDEGATFS